MEVVAAVPTNVGLQAQSSAASQAYVSSVAAYLQGETMMTKKEKMRRGDQEELVNGFFLGTAQGEEEGSESSSSIGEPEESSVSSTAEEKNEDDEVESKLKVNPLASLDALEESLPIKRGLSNYFSGKSKSFACLSEASNCCNAKDLGKQENPFNKRRRILMATKNSISRRASYSSLSTTSSLPPLNSSSFTVEEEEEEEEEEERRGGDLSSLPPFPIRVTEPNSKAFRSPRSFSLSDLQHA